MKSPIVLPLFALAALILSVVSMARSQPRRELSEPPSTPPRSEFPSRVAAVGLVEASSENISLSAHLAGVVEEIWVKAGQEVKEGEPLLKLDTRALEASRAERRAEVAAREAGVEVAKARVAKARAGLADVRRTLQFAESVSDPRSISAEELTRRRSAVEIAEAELGAAEADLSAAGAGVVAGRASLKSIETDLERSVIHSPIDGQILQLRIRVGEYASAGPGAAPWLVMGRTRPLHVRVDIDEQEGWRVRSDARAEAHVRGNSNLRMPLTFIRFEPFVIPKQSLTGAGTERVDTRVLQAIYRIEDSERPLFVGQQVDVFIEASDKAEVMAAR
ncbi:MAG: efflux RND transporter periplasmic adaptor subunit [Limisphaerales bacterium]